jgi:hypothetical protein
MQNEKSTETRPETHPRGDHGPETRTTALNGHRSDDCLRCGRTVHGRRRNGFCSDRCRMATRREEEANRKGQLLKNLKEAVAAVEAELISPSANGEER